MSVKRLQTKHRKTGGLSRDSASESAFSGSALLDSRLRILQLDKSFANLSVLPPGEAIGKELRVVTPEIAAALEPVLRKVLQTGMPSKVLLSCPIPTDGGAMRRWKGSCFAFRINGTGPHPHTVALILEDGPGTASEGTAPENGLRAILDNIPSPVFLKDETGRYLGVSREFEKLFGIREEQLRGRKDEEVFSPERAAFLRAKDQQVLDTGSAVVFEQSNTGMNSNRINVFHKFPIAASNGKLRGIGGVITDLTEQRTAEARFREAAEQFHFLIQGVKEYALFRLNPNGVIVNWDSATEGLRGYRAGDLVGQHFSCLYLTEDRRARKPEQALAIASARGAFREEGWRLRKDGSRFWAEVTISALRDERGNLRGFFNVNRDASERKAAEEALRQLSSQLLKLQDEERRRLARELHDSTAQQLTAIATYLAVIEKSSASMSKQSLNALAECRTLTEECHREIRTLSYLLHPPILDEIGLPDALMWYCGGFTKRSGIPVDAKISSAVTRLPSEVEGTLFRVVQECLTNIHRHSRSPSAGIRLDRNGTRLILEIRDKGRGLPLDMLVDGKINRARAGVGITGMQERIRNLQGQLEIESSKDGTVIRALIPIPEGDR